MTPNNNLSVLPFYEGVQYQDYKNRMRMATFTRCLRLSINYCRFKSYVRPVQITLYRFGCTIINLPAYWQT